MNRKKLPRAIRLATNDGEVTPALVAMERQGAPEQATASQDRPDGAAAPISGRVGDIFEIAPAGFDPDAARRRSYADAIVERHSKYSAVGGLIPLPIVNVAGITVVIVRMVKMLSDLYGVPFERERARAIVIGLMGGAMPTGLGAVAASTLTYVVPGSNLLALAVSSLAGVACTRGIGRAFVEHYESGATLLDFPAIERR